MSNEMWDIRQSWPGGRTYEQWQAADDWPANDDERETTVSDETVARSGETATEWQRYAVRAFPMTFSWTEATSYAVWDNRHGRWCAELSEFISTDRQEVQDCCDRWNSLEGAFSPSPSVSEPTIYERERVRRALQSSLARARAELKQTRDNPDKQAEYWEAVGRVTLCKRLARELGVELEWVDEREV